MMLGQTRLLQPSIYLPPRNTLSPIVHSKPNFRPFSIAAKPSNPNIRTPKFTALASFSPSPPAIPCKLPQAQTQPPMDDSTPTLKTLVLSATLMIFTKSFALKRVSRSQALSTMGPLFFASLNDGLRGFLNELSTMVPAVLSKTTDMYIGILMVRVLIRWSLNMHWVQQPLSAIRDLGDPLLRKLITPILGTLDGYPLLSVPLLLLLASINRFLGLVVVLALGYVRMRNNS